MQPTKTQFPIPAPNTNNKIVINLSDTEKLKEYRNKGITKYNASICVLQKKVSYIFAYEVSKLRKVEILNPMVPVMAISKDGTLYINYVFIGADDQITADQLAGALIHEVMHPSLKHFIRFEYVKSFILKKYPDLLQHIREDELADLWNFAIDAEINDIINEFNVSLPDGVIYRKDLGITDNSMNAERMFEYLVDKVVDIINKRKKNKSSNSPRNSKNNNQSSSSSSCSGNNSSSSLSGNGGGNSTAGSKNQQGQQQQQQQNNNTNSNSSNNSNNNSSTEKEEGGGSSGKDDNSPDNKGSGGNNNSNGKDEDRIVPKAINTGSGSDGIIRPWEQDVKPNHGGDQSTSNPVEDGLFDNIRDAIQNALRKIGKTAFGNIFDVQRVKAKDIALRIFRETYTKVYGKMSRSYSRPNLVIPPTQVIVPGPVGFKLKIGFVIDTSGSVSDVELGMVLDNLLKICKYRLRKNEVKILCVDTEPYEITLDEALKGKFRGRGGTDVMKAIEKLASDKKFDPDVILVFTDGYTEWSPERPKTRSLINIVLYDEKQSRPKWADQVFYCKMAQKQYNN